jgi:hypothetical protein
MQPGRGVPVIDVVRGRAPLRADEIALGATTLRNLHTHIGDSLDIGIGSVRQSFRIVGQAVFPRFAPYPASEPGNRDAGRPMLQNSETESTAAPTDVGNLASTVYRPLATLAPTSWTPVIEGGGNQWRIGAGVAGYDVLGYHGYAPEAHAAVLVGLLVWFAVTTPVHLLVTAVRRRPKELAPCARHGESDATPVPCRRP